MTAHNLIDPLSGNLEKPLKLTKWTPLRICLLCIITILCLFILKIFAAHWDTREGGKEALAAGFMFAIIPIFLLITTLPSGNYVILDKEGIKLRKIFLPPVKFRWNEIYRIEKVTIKNTDIYAVGILLKNRSAKYDEYDKTIESGYFKNLDYAIERLNYFSDTFDSSSKEVLSDPYTKSRKIYFFILAYIVSPALLYAIYWVGKNGYF